MIWGFMRILLHRYSKQLFWFLFIVILLGGIGLRHIGIRWGDLQNPGQAITFHPDEPKFMLIAQEFLEDDFSFKIHHVRSLDYVKGMGFKIATIARLLHHFFDSFSVANLYLIGRYLSLLYGILTLIVLYGIGCLIFRNRWKSLAAVFFLALSSLHTENSHYATGDVAAVFWIYLSILVAITGFKRPHTWHILVLSLCAGVAFATKFSILPVIPLIALICRSRHPLKEILVSIAATAFSFSFANGFYYSLDDFKISLDMLFSDNVSMRDHNKWLNPFTYFFQILTGMGLFSFIFVIIGFLVRPHFLSYFKNDDKINWWLKTVLFLPFLIYFFAICFLDTPFSRHLLPLVPVLCLIAAHGLSTVVEKLLKKEYFKTVTAMCLLLIVYQATYNYSIQYYFDNDPRFKAKRWAQKHIPNNAPIGASRYNYLPEGKSRLPNIQNHFSDADYLILHEAYYYRYFRSELNPFKPVKDINQVYRGSERNFRNLKNLFDGKLPFTLVKEYRVKAYTPELILHKKLLGTFPHFLGDVLIYKRTGEWGEE